MILKDQFHYIFPMSISSIFVDTYNIRLSECKDIIDYIDQYQITFNNFISLINKDLWMSKKNIKMTLQETLFRHLGKDYSALVSAIKTS